MMVSRPQTGRCLATVSCGSRNGVRYSRAATHGARDNHDCPSIARFLQRIALAIWLRCIGRGDKNRINRNQCRIRRGWLLLSNM